MAALKMISMPPLVVMSHYQNLKIKPVDDTLKALKPHDNSINPQS